MLDGYHYGYHYDYPLSIRPVLPPTARWISRPSDCPPPYTPSDLARSLPVPAGTTPIAGSSVGSRRNGGKREDRDVQMFHALHGTAIGLPRNGQGSMGRQSYGSPMECLGEMFHGFAERLG